MHVACCTRVTGYVYIFCRLQHCINGWSSCLITAGIVGCQMPGMRLGFLVLLRVNGGFSSVTEDQTRKNSEELLPV